MVKNEYLLVSLQFICFIMLWFIYGFKSHNETIFFIQIIAILLGLWSLIELSRSKVSIFPSVKKGASLVINGPFRLVRHPIYACILLYFYVFLIQEIILFGLMFVVLLTIVIISKVNLEEELLKSHFKNYIDYQKKTKKLIPYLY